MLESNTVSRVLVLHVANLNLIPKTSYIWSPWTFPGLIPKHRARSRPCAQRVVLPKKGNPMIISRLSWLYWYCELCSNTCHFSLNSEFHCVLHTGVSVGMSSKLRSTNLPCQLYVTLHRWKNHHHGNYDQESKVPREISQTIYEPDVCCLDKRSWPNSVPQIKLFPGLYSTLPENHLGGVSMSRFSCPRFYFILFHDTGRSACLKHNCSI